MSSFHSVYGIETFTVGVIVTLAAVIILFKVMWAKGNLHAVRAKAVDKDKMKYAFNLV